VGAVDITNDGHYKALSWTWIVSEGDGIKLRLEVVSLVVTPDLKRASVTVEPDVASEASTLAGLLALSASSRE
jgi:hypothetical protein